MIEWAKRELDLIPKDEDGMQDLINSQIIEVIEVFLSHGHSGFSASYAANIIKRLLDWKPLAPLTGEDDEWIDINGDMEQNKRYSSVFRHNKDNDTAYNISGKIFSDDGEIWYTNKDSAVKITFPYTVPNEPEKILLKKE